MRRHARLSLLCLVAASCTGGGGGGGGGGGTNATWVTDTSAYVYTSYTPVDTSSPDHVVTGTQATAAQMITDLQTALDACQGVGGVITFDTGGTDVTLTLSNQLDVPLWHVAGTPAPPIVVDGGGRITLDGNNTTRIMEKDWQADLTVQNISFVNGRVGEDGGDAGSAESGAAINVKNYDGRLTVINCQFDNCHCTPDGPDRGGGAIRAPGQRHVIISDCTFNNCSGSNGGAVNTLGSQLTIINSTFTNNEAHGYGGGADAVGNGGDGMGGIGGAIYTDGISQNADLPRFVLYDCVLTGNRAGDHGGAIFHYTIASAANVSVICRCTFDDNAVNYNAATNYLGRCGAIYAQGTDLTVVDSTFSNNDAHDGAGAIAIYSDKTCRIANCTFYNNSAFDDAATGSLGGAVEASGATAYFSHCTFADNAAKAGAAIRAGSGTWLKNCVFSNNLGTTEWNGHQTWITCNDGGNNVMWPEDRSIWGTTDLPVTATAVIADPLLAALADNGGPTQTMALQSGSPCIDIGSTGDSPATDQRGQARDADPDAGAYEY